MGRIAPDNNDVFVMMLNQTNGTHINTGTLGAAGNWTEYGGPISGVQGIFDDALYIPGAIISTNRDGAGGGNDTVVSPNVSMSGWVFYRKYAGTFQELFVKQYFLNAWNSPFLTFGIQITSSQDGSWDFFITTAGVLRQLSVLSNDAPIPVGRWCHMGATWDGTTLRAYLNGTEVKTLVPPAAAIDYGTLGATGRWFCGSIPDGGAIQGGQAIMQDIRVANVVRPQSYFANIYYNGFTP